MTDPTRLSAELLLRLRLERDAEMSAIRSAESLLKNERVKLLASSATTAHFLVRSTNSSFTVGLQVVGSGRVQFQCECTAFRNGFICAHILASVQLLAEHLRSKTVVEQPQENWETELASIFGDLSSKEAATAKRTATPRQLLFFSIQERASDRWGIYPYSLPTKSFPPEFFDNEGVFIVPPDTVAKHLKTEKLDREGTSVRTVDSHRFPGSTGGERQAALLLGAVASLGGYGYYYGSIPAGLYEQVLSLLTGSENVYFGTETIPLRQRVDLLPEGVLRPGIQVTTNAGGMRLTPALLPTDPNAPEAHAPILLAAGKEKFAFKSPSYLLTSKGKMVPLPGEVPEAFRTLAARGEIAIPEAGKSLFIERYLLPLAERMPVAGDAISWQEDDTEALSPLPRLYLTEENGRLLAHLRYAYGPHEYPYDSSYPSQAVERGEIGQQGAILHRVRRSPEAESARYATLSGTGGSAYGLKRDDEPGYFTLRARTDPVDFLLHSVPKLAEAGYEVYGDENLKSVRVNRSKPTVSFHVSSGIDWLDIDAMLAFGDTEVALADVKRAIRRREKYVKLADGSIGVIPPEIIEKFRFLLALGEETKDGGLRLSNTQALLLEQAVTDASGDLKADEEFYRRRRRLQAFEKIEPKPLPTHGLNATLYPYQKAAYDWLHFLHEYGFGGCLADEMGLGKAQPLDAKILTPTGWVRMGDIRPGMLVIGKDGQPTQVTGVYPQGEKEIFRVTFSDGATTECCDEHLWQVNTPLRKSRGNAPVVCSLQEIRGHLRDAAGNCRHFIPIVAPVAFEESELPLPIAPYLLGALLGDGCIRDSVMFSTGDAEMLARLQSLLPDTCEIRHRSDYDYIFALRDEIRPRINPIKTALKNLGLMGKGSEDKFVPDIYKFASAETRLAVLQGLMDTDGWVTKADSTVGFSSCSEQLADDVIFLVRSLGGTARKTIKQTAKRPAYNVIVAMPSGITPFALARKAEVYRPRPKYPPTRAIVQVESIGIKPAQCISVESPDRLYVTDDFIVTHNTLEALSFLVSNRKAGGSTHATAPDLVVAPRSLVFNWEREAARFAPDLKVLVYADNSRAKDPSAFEGYDLVLTTYGILLRDIEHLRQTRFHYAVLDEAQAIKNPLSQSARAARLINSDHRLTLTGTPVENGTMELWSQFAFLNPGHLGGMDRFKEEFAGAIERHQDETATQTLRRLISPFLLRRTKDQVAPELPARTEQVVYCEMDAEQRKLYDQMRDSYRAEVMGMLDNAESDRALAGKGRMKMLEALLRLRQVCCHPRLARPDYTGDSAKFGILLDTLETLRAENHKALIFSQFVKMLDIIRQALDERGIPYVYLDGSTKDRKTPVDRFQEDTEIPFFLISLKAGGVGLNLTAADYVLHVDPWWNPAAERQATDRAHRIGQDKPVFVYKFLTRDTVEEKILALQDRKRVISEQLITAEEGGFLKALSREDIESLFT